MYDKLEDNNQKSLKQLLECAFLSEEVYMQALDRSSGSTSIMLTTPIQHYLKYGEQTWTFNMSLILGPVPCTFCLISLRGSADGEAVEGGLKGMWC